MQAETDRELLESYAGSGDEKAFATLVSRHGPIVHRVCLGLLRDAHEAEDAAALMGCGVTALRGRVRDGLARLRKRLARRGAVLSIPALAGLLKAEASAAVPTTLLPSFMAAPNIAVGATAAGIEISDQATAMIKVDPNAPIIFSSNRSGAWRIWSVNPDGSGLRQVIEGGAEEVGQVANDMFKRPCCAGSARRLAGILS